MNAKTKAPAPRFTVGQRVEVETRDFKAAGMPAVWVAGTVTEVTLRDCGKWDVMVVADQGSLHPQIVGRRGGNCKVREL